MKQGNVLFVPFDGDRLDARDPELIARLLPAVRAFNAHYLRLRVRGREHIPDGPALFVANHNGGIAGPDLLCTLGTLWEARGPHAPIHALAHDFAMRQFTPLGRVLQRLGAIRASHENAVRALSSGGQVLVYPGGDLDAYRHASRRDEIVFGTRNGFVRVARQIGAPIVPIVAHGAHRSGVVLTEGEWLARKVALAKWARLQRFPIALALPWGVALGPWIPWMPLPFPISLEILPPMTVTGTDDEERERVRETMQRSLTRMAREA